MALPQRGVAYTFIVTLLDEVTGEFKSNPTIAEGDFKISRDDAAYVNLATTPVVSPTGDISVKISLSASEMTVTDDYVIIKAIDVAGNEWQPLIFEIKFDNTDDIVWDKILP